MVEHMYNDTERSSAVVINQFKVFSSDKKVISLRNAKK